MTSARDNTLYQSEIGTKAFNLRRLSSMGLPVPDMFLLPVANGVSQIEELEAWLASIEKEQDGRWKLVVRSSSVDEDTHSESKAGHFLSLLGEFNDQELINAILRVQSSGPRVGVVVQKLIAPKFAGVFVSCDPLSFKRKAATIAWTEGLADKLMGGIEPGRYVRLDVQGQITEGRWPGNTEVLDQISSAATQLERDFKAPVDIEWAVDCDDRLWFLQARPVVLPKSSAVRLSDIQSFDILPAMVQGHHKIRLRRKAAERNVQMAPAIVETWAGAEFAGDEIEAALAGAAAASVVLMHPEHIDCSVVREFAPLAGFGPRSWMERCRRYSIRRYPSVDGVRAARESVLKAGLSQSWVAVAIIQAVLPAPMTGIIRRSNDGYIIDIAQGHFVPKGVTEVSSIILTRDHKLLEAEWRDQSIAYHFIDGHVVTEAPLKQQRRISDHQLASIARSLDPLFDEYRDAALEFGLIEREGDLSVYLIDVAESDSTSITLDQTMIGEGVLSRGVCRGRIRRIDNSTAGALDRHLHDKHGPSKQADGNVVIVAEYASTDLLSQACAPGVVGFVFRHASILAHLSVVLREKGIPAIAIPKDDVFTALTSGKIIEIDAASPLLLPDHRLHLVNEQDV